jgi:hypothetical protein
VIHANAFTIIAVSLKNIVIAKNARISHVIYASSKVWRIHKIKLSFFHR